MSSSRTSAARATAGVAVGALALAAVAALPGAASAAPGQVAASSAAAAPGVAVVSNERELRAAVQAANQRPGVDRIRLDDRITFSRSRLTNGGARFGDLDVLGPLVVDGAGRVIDAQSVDRVFDVRPGARLVLKDLHLRNGRAADGESGGAARSQGRLVLRHSSVFGSVVSGDGASGGAIVNDGGTLVLMNSRLTNNQSARAGGAIEAVGGDTSVVESRLTRNATGSGPGNGGALHLTGAGNVYVAFSRVARNTAASEGGGLWNSAEGTFLVDRSEIVANAAAGATSSEGGGGLYNDGGSLSVISSKVRGNEATGEAGSGGGILSVAGGLDVEETSLIANHSQRAGGGIEVVDGDVSILRSSLVANDAGAAPGNGGGLHVTGAATILVGGSLVQRQHRPQRGRRAVEPGRQHDGGAQHRAEREHGLGPRRRQRWRRAVQQRWRPHRSRVGPRRERRRRRRRLRWRPAHHRRHGRDREDRGLRQHLGPRRWRHRGCGRGHHGASLQPERQQHRRRAGQRWRVPRHRRWPGGPASTVLVAGSEVIGNTAAREGGGLWNQAGTTMTVRGSTISDNTASGAGGRRRRRRAVQQRRRARRH